MRNKIIKMMDKKLDEILIVLVCCNETSEDSIDYDSIKKAKQEIIKLIDRIDFRKKGNIAWCPYWQPALNIKKCNWCLNLEKKL